MSYIGIDCICAYCKEELIVGFDEGKEAFTVYPCHPCKTKKVSLSGNGSLYEIISNFKRARDEIDLLVKIYDKKDGK